MNIRNVFFEDYKPNEKINTFGVKHREQVPKVWLVITLATIAIFSTIAVQFSKEMHTLDLFKGDFVYLTAPLAVGLIALHTLSNFGIMLVFFSHIGNLTSALQERL